MGQGLSKIPDRCTDEEFVEIFNKNTPLPHANSSTSSIFEGLRTPDGRIERDVLREFSKATDVFLSHEWGYDDENRSTHDRVMFVNQCLKQAGYVTWLDREQENKPGAEQMSMSELRVDAIQNTQVVLVFITKRYIELLSEGVGIDGGDVYDANDDPLSPGYNSVQVDLAAAVEAKRNFYATGNSNKSKSNSKCTSKYSSGTNTPTPKTSKSQSTTKSSRTGCSKQYKNNNTQRKPKFFRNIVPIVLDPTLTKPETWGPVLRPILGGRLKYDLSGFHDLLTDAR